MPTGTDKEFVTLEAFSENLSQVMEDIGINDDIVQSRRKTYRFIEDMYIIHTGVSTTRFFGSQTEGSTTIDLNADSDMLCYKNAVHVVQSMSEIDFCKVNLMAVKDETTAPGYCRLHYVMRLLPTYLSYFKFCVEKGNVCLLNEAIFPNYETLSPKTQPKNRRHGPSKKYMNSHSDDVTALRFTSWPKESKAWLSKAAENKWPSADMMKMIKDQTCLLVPVGHKQSDRRRAEWRISYAETERYLMFSLNIIQLQCYVMLKLIKQRYFSKKIKSYNLKMIFFFTISQLADEEWSRKSLFSILIRCLKTLSWCLQSGYCSNFINTEVNLFQGKFSLIHRKELHARVVTLMQNGYRCIFGIKSDDVGRRLWLKCAQRPICSGLLSRYEVSQHIKYTLEYALIKKKGFFIHASFNEERTCFGSFSRLLYFLKHGTMQEKAAAFSLLPGFLGNFAAIGISHCISSGDTVYESLFWFLKFGRIFEKVSTSLKLATIYYKLGRIDDAILIVNDLECSGKINMSKVYNSCWTRSVLLQERYLMSEIEFALCVSFLRQELSICPPALVFEMYRSTKYDKLYRYYDVDNWMDTAEIDSLPYFYWLKYYMFSDLKLEEQAHSAVLDLIETIRDVRHFRHPETLFNLVGQHFANRGIVRYALHCYTMSLKCQPRNNAAKWLLGLLVYKQFPKAK